AFRTLPPESVPLVAPVYDAGDLDLPGTESAVTPEPSSEPSGSVDVTARNVPSVSSKLPQQLSRGPYWHRNRFRKASLALVFTAATLVATSLTGLINSRMLPWQFTQLGHSGVPSAPHLDGVTTDSVPELALDEPVIDLPSEVTDKTLENAVH
ncbi:MAG: hypothetical protein AAFU53_13205, partial [Cyanobacteria bacterium J06632_3]